MNTLAEEREAFEEWAINTKQAYRSSIGIVFYNTPAANLTWAGWLARSQVEPIRAQKMRDAGYTRRPTLREL